MFRKLWLTEPPNIAVVPGSNFSQRPVLHLGWSTEWKQSCINELQTILNEKGFLDTHSGHFDKDTSLAVKVFQREHGLKPDGIVGPLTWTALLFPILRRTKTISPELKDKVKALQTCLRDERLDVEVDGFFGPKTQQAVKRFQRRYKLHPDGICGYLTWSIVLGQKPEWVLPPHRFPFFLSSLGEQTLIIGSIVAGIYFDPLGEEVTLSIGKGCVIAYGLSCVAQPIINRFPIDRLTNYKFPLMRYAPYVLTGFFWQPILNGLKELL